MDGVLVKDVHVTNIPFYQGMTHFKFWIELVARYGIWLQTHWMHEYTEADSQQGLMFGLEAMKFSLFNTSLLQNVTLVMCPKNVQ